MRLFKAINDKLKQEFCGKVSPKLRQKMNENT